MVDTLTITMEDIHIMKGMYTTIMAIGMAMGPEETIIRIVQAPQHPQRKI